jgi:hypothetical protein
MCFFVFLCSLEMHKQLNPELAAAAAAAAAVSAANNPNANANAAMAMNAAAAAAASMASLHQPLGQQQLKFPPSLMSTAQGQPLFDTLGGGQPKSLTTKLKGGQSPAMFVQTSHTQNKKQNGAGTGGGAGGGGKFAPY